MNNIIVSMYNKSQNEAGPKAKIDVENFLKIYDFKIQDFYFYGGRRAELVSYRQSLFDIPFRLKGRYENAIFQYPALNERTSKAIMRNLKKNSQKVYILIHDLESLRFKNGGNNFELDLLNMSDGVIAHNKKMIDWLRNNGVEVPIVDLEIFDYDNNIPLQENNIFDKSVCYAGNLNKAAFLKEYEPDFKLTLFGPNFSPALISKHIEYRGSLPPDELAKELLTQNFGLIWDGDSSKECSGVYGEYLKYNNPHKTSLYLSSGMPIIIWREAALAEFVDRNKLGIVVDNLSQIKPILDKMTREEYQEIKSNTIKIAHKLRSGFYIKKAITELGVIDQ